MASNRIAFLLLVAMPFVPSSFLLLVAMPGATSSVLAPNLIAMASNLIEMSRMPLRLRHNTVVKCCQPLGFTCLAIDAIVSKLLCTAACLGASLCLAKGRRFPRKHVRTQQSLQDFRSASSIFFFMSGFFNAESSRFESQGPGELPSCLLLATAPRTTGSLAHGYHPDTTADTGHLNCSTSNIPKNCPRWKSLNANAHVVAVWT